MQTITVAEIAKKTGLTPRAVQKRAKKESWPYMSGQGKGKIFHINDLPLDIQEQLIRHDADLDDIPHLSATDNSPVWLTPKESTDPRIGRKLKVYQYIKSLPRYAGREEAAEIFAQLYGVHRSTIWRWVEWVERRKGARRSQSGVNLLPKSVSFSPQALAYGLATYARNIRCGKKAAYMALEDKAFRSGWKIGDYTSFTRLLKKVPKDVWTRLEKGDLGFELECVPKIIRKWLAVPVQSVICGDQKIFDYLVYEPETDRIMVLNAYLWMDCASRFVNGAWVELGHYNSYTVGYSLREALRYGIPEEIFTDWGMPEGSNHIAHIRRSIQELSYTGNYSDFADKYYLDHRKAQPCKPWQKPIENIMNQIDILMKRHFAPGYRKRAGDTWENKEIQKKLKSEIKSGELLTVEEFIDLFFKTIDEHNHKRKKLREGKTIIPAEVFKKGLESQNRIRLPETTLDYVCLPTWQRVPRQGKVGVQVRPGDFREYFSFKLTGLDRVQVTIDPYDTETPAVITDLEGNFIDIAEPVPNVVPGRASSEAERFFAVRAEYMKEIRSKTRAIKDAFGLVDKKEIIAIGKTSHTARKARKEIKTRDEALEHERRQAKVLRLEAKRGRRELREKADKAKVKSSKDDGFCIPVDSREKYRLWKQLDSRKQNLSAEEFAFWNHFQSTADFSAFRTLEEDFGDLFSTKECEVT